MKNLYHAKRLAYMDFGGSIFRDDNGDMVEDIQHEAGIAGMYESFTEAGPQSVVQLAVIFCTGSSTEVFAKADDGRIPH